MEGMGVFGAFAGGLFQGCFVGGAGALFWIGKWGGGWFLVLVREGFAEFVVELVL